MNPTERTRLMHAVLDGEATPERGPGAGAPPGRRSGGARGVRRAARPVRRAFQRAQGLSPGGARRLGDGPHSAISRWSRAASANFSRGPRVIGQVSKEAPGTSPGTSARVHRVSPQGPYFRSENMSEEKSGSFGKRKVWIGGGIAAAAVILAVSSGIDFPPSGKDTAGTIVPAQRYRAPQDRRCSAQSGNLPDHAGRRRAVPLTGATPSAGPADVAGCCAVPRCRSAPCRCGRRPRRLPASCRTGCDQLRRAADRLRRCRQRPLRRRLPAAGCDACRNAALRRPLTAGGHACGHAGCEARCCHRLPTPAAAPAATPAATPAADGRPADVRLRGQLPARHRCRAGCSTGRSTGCHVKASDSTASPAQFETAGLCAGGFAFVSVNPVSFGGGREAAGMTRGCVFALFALPSR